MEKNITEIIIGAAIDVHSALGPGLLESAYQECLLFELKSKDLSVQILTYMKLGNYPLGLLINFNTKLLKNGLRRFINSN